MDEDALTKAMIVRAIVVYLIAITAILVWTRLTS
jgi:hypothetical protein